MRGASTPGAGSINGFTITEPWSEGAYDARKPKAVTERGERRNSNNRHRRLGTAMDRAAAATEAVEFSQRRHKSRGGQTPVARTCPRVDNEHQANNFSPQALPISQKRDQGRERFPGVIDLSPSPVKAGLPTDVAPSEVESEVSPPRNGRRSADLDCKQAPLSTRSFDRNTPLSKRQAVVEGRGQRLPTIVTPLTLESDEQDRRRDNTSASSSVTPAAHPPPSERPSLEEREWPKVTLAASLDFSGRSVWEVSHVVVKQPNRHRSGAEKNSDEIRAFVVICHSGGVSSWVLTDVEAVCTHLSPALAGVPKERVRGRFFAAAVAGGDEEIARSTPEVPRGVKTCIVAIGRHETDPGLPIIRVWQGPPLEAGDLRCRAAPDKKAMILTTILKKKFSTFFPPMATRDSLPHLCLCEFTAAVETKDDSCGTWDGGINPGEITCVMALGAKAIKIVCTLGKSNSANVRAKSLPTGAVDNEGVINLCREESRPQRNIKPHCQNGKNFRNIVYVQAFRIKQSFIPPLSPLLAQCTVPSVSVPVEFTSLAAVPDNPFLVWASLPLSNALLLWDVQELHLLFTLPLTAWTFCVPVVSLPSEHGKDSPDSRPRRLRSSSPETPQRRDPALLCVLATGDRVQGRSEHFTTAGLGCEFYGVYVEVDGGSQGSSISAVRLDGQHEASTSCNESPRR